MITKITAVSIENFKRIAQVNFSPDEMGITIIGGNNRQGKTSVLDAIMWGLGGAKFAPSQPNNLNGHGDAEIRIALNNGVTVERKGKNGSIKVTDQTGKKAGQELLNELIGALALNLPKFMDAGDREKATILLDTLGIRDKLAELDDREKILYDERTEIGRIALSLKKHADEMPYHHDAPEQEISAATIIEKQRLAVERNNANAAVRKEYESMSGKLSEFSRQLAEFDAETSRLEEAFAEKIKEENRNLQSALNENSARIAQLEEEIVRLREQRNAITGRHTSKIEELNRVEQNRRSARTQKRDAGTKMMDELKGKIEEKRKQAESLPEDIDLSAFTGDIEELEAKNAKFRANKAHDLAAAEAKAKENEYAEYTAKVEAVRRERMELLASVKMPLSGLTVKDGLIYYNGQRWDCMSGSERLIVGTSIVRAVNPNCGFVLMDKLEQMDLNSLDEFDEWLKRENLQVIATRVSTGDECAIVIEDGKVAVREQ